MFSCGRAFIGSAGVVAGEEVAGIVLRSVGMLM